MSISCPVQTAGWPSRPDGALVVVVAAQVLVERFQRPPVLAKGIIGESCPPQTIIWSVPSMRVKTAECAARAVGASTIEIGDQLSARSTDPVIKKAKHNSIRQITVKNLPLREDTCQGKTRGSGFVRHSKVRAAWPSNRSFPTNPAGLLRDLVLFAAQARS